MKVLLIVAVGFAAFAPTSFAQKLAETSIQSHVTATREAKIIAKKAAETVSLPYDAGRVRYLANAEETGGQWGTLELVEGAGYKTPLHRHPRLDEAFYVVEGVLTARIGDDTKEFGPGSFVLVPRGTIHAQGNFGKAPVKLLVITSPSGLEEFFADRVELFKDVKPGHPEFEKRLTAIITDNDIVVVGPWEP